MSTMKDEIYVMREAITKITQMLAGKSVQVTQQGIGAYVKADPSGKPYLVNLPYIPDNATHELIEAIKGFLDHEVAHILFTDFTAMDRCSSGAAAGMLNLLEDSRIEREMAKRFQGSALNLANMGNFFLEKYTKPKVEEAKASGNVDELIGVLMVPLMRAMAGQEVFQGFMKEHMGVMQPVYERLKHLQPQIESLSSTGDALTVAEEVTKILKNADGGGAGSPAKSTAKKGAGGGKKGKGKAAGPKGKSEDEDEEKGAGDKDKDEDEEGKGEKEEKDPTAGDEDVGDKEDDESAGADAVHMDDADDDSDDLDLHEADDSADPREPDGEPGEQDIAEQSAISFKEIEKELAHDYDDVVSDTITNSAADAARGADYLVFTKDKDIVEPLTVGKTYRDEWFKAVSDDVDHMVGPLQKDLERAIAARSLASWTPGQRSGRLHAANLSRLAINDPRVFRRKAEVTTKDVAVELVVDMSGSMSGSKIATATRAAYALSAVLERIGIANEVICFTTGAGVADGTVLRSEAAKIGRHYSRVEQLYMPILKGFDERLTVETKKRFGWLPHCGDLRNNVDGESVELAWLRLLKRREKGKIMFVLSDGAPHAAGHTASLAPHLKKVVERIGKSGVTCIGIGIESSEVRRFYPKSLVLSDVSELPTVVMKELRQLIAA